jgi:hypothetical protein
MELTTTEQDFLDIKENLKNYLRSQEVYVDYDFDGSAMSTLLDVLAYNTHYNAMTAKMAVNEMFLDTAQIRSNVVAIAKSLNYTPQSMRSAVIGFTLQGDAGTDSITLLKGTKFKSVADNGLYKFTLLKDYTATAVDGNVTFDVVAHEGTFLTNTVTVASSTERQIYQIPNKACDTTSLTVTVKALSGATESVEYTRAISLNHTLENDEVYFIQEGANGNFEIYFGDGIIGKKLDVGNEIVMKYLKTKGDLGNNISKLSWDNDPISGLSEITITDETMSNGGTGVETINSIKKNAPFDYSAQNRAVTANDYRSIIKKVYPETSEVIAWGGEDNNPPVYGKVFISIKPITSSNLTKTTKDLIKSELRKYRVASIKPEIIDPEYTFINLDINFKFNPKITDLTSSELETAVRANIDTYASETLDRFNVMYRNSNVSTMIDATDTSIMSSVVKHRVYKEIVPVYNTSASYSVNFANSIYHPHSGHLSKSSGGEVQSNKFKIVGSSNTYFMEDDGKGNIKLCYTSTTTGSAVIVSPEFGIVEYTSGLIYIPSLNISGLSSSTDEYLTFTTVLDSYDIIPVRNEILKVNNISISGVEDFIESDPYVSDITYTTSSSRL